MWLGGVAAFRFVPAARILMASPEDTARLVPAQAMALQAFLLYAVGASAGMLLGQLSASEKKVSPPVHHRFTPSVIACGCTIHQGAL